MFKTIALFLLTNIAVMITASIVLSLLGLTGYVRPGAINYSALMIICLVWGMSFSFVSLLLSKTTAKWMTGAEVVSPASPGEYGSLARKVQDLARAANLPASPEVAVYPSDELNAFATGPSKRNSLVCVSSGLLRRMNSDEIEGVLAHELSHISNGDMIRMTLIQGVVNAFVMFFARIAAYSLSQFVKDDQRFIVHFLSRIVLEIAFGILGMLIVNWFSRQREFRADAGGAHLAGRPKMIAALESLKRFSDRNQDEEATATPALASLKISGKSSGFISLFATHPQLELRIAALKQAAPL